MIKLDLNNAPDGWNNVRLPEPYSWEAMETMQQKVWFVTMWIIIVPLKLANAYFSLWKIPCYAVFSIIEGVKSSPTNATQILLGIIAGLAFIPIFLLIDWILTHAFRRFVS